MPQVAASLLAANTGSECAGVGALFRPHVSVCACGCLCKFSGRPWELILYFPVPEVVADGRCSPHMKHSLYPHWLLEQGEWDMSGLCW